MIGSGGHEFSDTHRCAVQARELSKRLDAKRKAEGKSAKKSSDSFKQCSLFGSSKFPITVTKKQKPNEKQATDATSSRRSRVSCASGSSGNGATNEGDDDSSKAKSSGSKAASMPQRDRGNNSNCTGIIPISRLVSSNSNAIRLDVGTLVTYGVIVSKDYGAKVIGTNTDMVNIFHNECTGHAILRAGKRNGGLRCAICSTYWTNRSSLISRTITSRTAKFINVLNCLMKPSLTDEDAESMG